jgi:DNA-binding Lrp family transcriptional regulator
VEDVSSLPLTRRQRYIYFLVDGRRSIADLSRTTGKSIQEVELILRELQEQGLIAI